MSTEIDNAEFIKKEIRDALDQKFGPLLLQMAKMIKEISESAKSQNSVNEIVMAKLNLMYSLQTEMQKKLFDFDEISGQFDKLDKNLAKFLQKSVQDTQKIQEQIQSFGKVSKEVQIPSQKTDEVKISQENPTLAEIVPFVEIPNLIADMDVEEIKSLIAEFSKKEIFTTEALRLIETTRDKLLFEREDEVPYRAFAAKIFREILAIIKQEKDFRTISNPAAQEVKKHLFYLQEHM